MDFTEHVLKARPNIKPNSAKAYATSLKLLAPENAQSLDFLLDSKEIIAKLDKYKHTTRRNYLNAVIIVLKGDSEHPEVQEILEKYEDLRDQYNNEYADQQQSHKKTDRQKEIWIDWDEFLGIVDKLEGEVADYKPGTWTPQQKQTYQEYLLTLLYSHYPLRNDFITRVISKTDYNRLASADKEKENFLVKHNTNKYFFVMNQYKTSKKYGEKNIEVKPELLKPLRKWLRHNTSDHLFVNSKGDPLNSNGITKVLNRIGTRLRGKPFGSSILRHSYLSHKYAQTQVDKQKDAELMGHSVQTQQEYVKVDEGSVGSAPSDGKPDVAEN